MKNLNIIVLLLLSLFFHNHLPAQSNREFRATWVITWEHKCDKDRIIEILDNHVKSNMSAVLFQIRQSGTAYYNSSYEPWGYYANYENPGFDPLAFAVKEAHKRGLELHAWFNTFHTSSTRAGTPAGDHPEWVCRDGNDKPMPSNKAISPGLQEVREYTIDVAMEIVNNYNIDGLHLDYVRWNEYTNDDLAKPVPPYKSVDGMISQSELEKLNQTADKDRYLYDINHKYSDGVPEGFDSWEEWWRWSVTEFVNNLHDSIQAVKPWVKLSPAALGKYKEGGNYGWNGYYRVYQDAAKWFNNGYIELLTPMHYHWKYPNGFYNELTEDWEPYIQPGIDAGRIYSVGPGSYILDRYGVWSNHRGIVEKCRTLDWVNGFHFFSYDYWVSHNYWDTAAETFFSVKPKIPKTDFLLSRDIEAPQLSISRIDTSSYELEVTPSTIFDEGQWLVVYESLENNIDRDSTQIRDIKYSDYSFTYEIHYDPELSYEDKYYFSVSICDRYWNESQLSNTLMIDDIPSFPPALAYSTISDGDTIKPYQELLFVFDHPVDQNSFEDNFQISPSIDITEYQWTEDSKSVKLVIAEELDAGTSYQFKIPPTVVGKYNQEPFDGDQDGTGGDALSMTIQTEDTDTQGPKIVSYYPNTDAAKNAFDVNNVLTITFDEIINHNSINDSTISLLKIHPEAGEIETEIYYSCYDINNKTIVTINPLDDLIADQDYKLIFLNHASDKYDNKMSDNFVLNFTTENFHYSVKNEINDMSHRGSLTAPYLDKKSTNVNESISKVKYEVLNQLPGTYPPLAPFITYLWNDSEETSLLYEKMEYSAARVKIFDTTGTIQLFIFGDNSNNKFRFCLEEYQNDEFTGLEVSKWIDINWYGWRLVEWDMDKAAQTGAWDLGQGDGILNGDRYHYDSFQFTQSEKGSTLGKIGIDDLLYIEKKSGRPAKIANKNTNTPQKFTLYQNYPNPFNPTTTIKFSVPNKSHVRLNIYDLSGSLVDQPVNKVYNSGSYETTFNGKNLASGIYFYQLITEEKVITRKMMLIK